MDTKKAQNLILQIMLIMSLAIFIDTEYYFDCPQFFTVEAENGKASITIKRKGDIKTPMTIGKWMPYPKKL